MYIGEVPTLGAGALRADAELPTSNPSGSDRAMRHRRL